MCIHRAHHRPRRGRVSTAGRARAGRPVQSCATVPRAFDAHIRPIRGPAAPTLADPAPFDDASRARRPPTRCPWSEMRHPMRRSRRPTDLRGQLCAFDARRCPRCAIRCATNDKLVVARGPWRPRSAVRASGRAFRQVESMARAHGHGAVIGGWEPVAPRRVDGRARVPASDTRAGYAAECHGVRGLRSLAPHSPSAASSARASAAPSGEKPGSASRAAWRSLRAATTWSRAAAIAPA